MKKFFSVLLILFVFSQSFTTPAFASEGQPPVGGCPPVFEIHPFMHHSGEHMHTHIGIVQDLNGDGFICMRMVSPTRHLQIDNVIP